MDGIVNLQLSAKSVGVFEAFYNSIKPITLVNQTVEIQKTGKLYHSLNYMLCVFVCVYVTCFEIIYHSDHVRSQDKPWCFWIERED